MTQPVNYRSLCVRTRKGEILYPKAIPKERGSQPIYIFATICVLLFLGDYWSGADAFQEILKQYAAGITASVILQIIYRIILMTEEVKHLISRYENKILELIKDTFYLNPSILWTLAVCVLYNVYFGVPFEEVSLRKLLFAISNIYLLGKLLRLSDCPLNDSLWIAEDNGLDYGSGMAYSFFYGYLQYVLPKTGGEDKDLREIIQDYEDKNGVKFMEYKLFILIPKSMECFVSLKNEFSPSVEESSSLEEKIRTVAGVTNRVYKNAVYKIVLSNKKKCYVAAEFATPLKTFNNVIKSTGGHSKSYNKLKKDIILQFYLTLGRVLKENHLSQSCELIYYEDSYEEDGQTKFYDVGKIIQTRLEELQKLKKKED